MKVFFKKLLCCTLAILMLLTMLAACGKEEEEITTEPEETTEEKEAGNPLLAPAFTETSICFFDTDPYISYITYNGYNNPIEERAVSVLDLGIELITRYQYDNDGLLTKVECNMYECRYGYGKASPYYSVEYTVENGQYTSNAVYTNGDTKPEEELTSAVEYYDNGIIKKWSISMTDNSEFAMIIERDSIGRRTLYTDEGGIKVTYTYTSDSREISGCTLVDGENSIIVPIEYTDKSISKITLDYSATSNDHYVCELEHTQDRKTLANVMIYSYEENVLCDQYSIEYSRNEAGVYSEIKYTEYENATASDYEVYEFIYNSDNLVTKKTQTLYSQAGEKQQYSITEVEYDNNVNITKTVEKSYNGDGSFKSHFEIAYEYVGEGWESKITESYYNEDGSLKSKCVQEFEYDSNGVQTKFKYTEYDGAGNITNQFEKNYDN